MLAGMLTIFSFIWWSVGIVSGKPDGRQIITMQLTEKPLFRIDYDGQWLHDGAPIRRRELAKLFADKGLRIDESGRYWLQSPEEKYAVEVDDVPFLIIDYDINSPGEDQEIDLKTNMGHVLPLGPEHILELRNEPRSGVRVPYIEVKKGLYARLERAVFYNLIDHAQQDRGRIIIRSRKMDHCLGRLEES
jgi:hypothetical protein